MVVLIFRQRRKKGQMAMVVSGLTVLRLGEQGTGRWEWAGNTAGMNSEEGDEGRRS